MWGRRSTVVGLLLGAWVVATAARGMGQTLPGRDAQCRYKVANAARVYGDYLTQRIATCHQWRMKGKLPAAIDCNDPATWNANGYARGNDLMQKTFLKVRRIVEGCRPTAGTVASLGYNSCPAPCAAVTVSNFADVAACMRCLVDDCALAAATAVYGTPPLPAAPPERNCQQIIGRKLNVYMTKRAYLEAVCQYNRERGKPAFAGLDCLDIDNPANTMHYIHIRALNDLNTLITNQCTPVDMAAELDSCGSDAASAIACLLAQSSACADSLFAATFPTIP